MKMPKERRRGNPKEKKIMTKTQAIKAAEKLAEKLADLISELEDLQNEVQEQADSIEPYEGKDDLTSQQEERQEWFSDSADTLQNALDQAQEAQSELENIC